MSEEAILRARVVEEAKLWIGTPYRHMGRVRGSGADCATFLAEVYERAGACPHIPIDFYPFDWNLHRGSERFLSIVTKFAHEIAETDTKPGDVVMYKFGRVFAHGAIIVDPGWPSIINADVKCDAVVYADGSIGVLANRDRLFYSLW